MEVNIITNGWPDSQKNEILLDSIQMIYVQNGDCTEDKDTVQELTIRTRDNGVAKFLNLETKNWSIDDTDSLVAIINDFKKRINYEDSGDS